MPGKEMCLRAAKVTHFQVGGYFRGTRLRQISEGKREQLFGRRATNGLSKVIN